ncbi:hypothetical protein [Polaromonas sp.]|nr:hypothetical protein [Polaromonas sp.]
MTPLLGSLRVAGSPLKGAAAVDRQSRIHAATWKDNKRIASIY